MVELVVEKNPNYKVGVLMVGKLTKEKFIKNLFSFSVMELYQTNGLFVDQIFEKENVEKLEEIIVDHTRNYNDIKGRERLFKYQQAPFLNLEIRNLIDDFLGTNGLKLPDNLQLDYKNPKLVNLLFGAGGTSALVGLSTLFISQSVANCFFAPVKIF